MRLDRLSRGVVPRASRPDGQSENARTKFFLASASSVSLTRVHTCPLGSQKARESTKAVGV